VSAPVAMKGYSVMPDSSELSEAKRALLEKFLRGDITQAAKVGSVGTQYAEAEVVDPREGVVPIQVGGPKLPFFFLHGDWISGAYWCFSLAHQLGSDQPFYALEPFNFDGLPIPPPFEAIAAAHLKSLRAVQPEGPYLLGGFCNGGLLAYEMARQLHVQGQKVDLLVLMDPMGLVYPARHRLASGLINRIGELMRLGKDKQLNGYVLFRHLYNYLRWPVYRRLEGYERFRWFASDEEIEPGRKHNKASPGFPKLDALFPRVEVLRQDYPAVYDWIAMRYTAPGLYPGKITFFWDSEQPWRRMGWRKAAETNEIEVHIIPGRQMPMRTKYLNVLAKHLNACLRKMQANA
jgi:Thioesterase domain